MKNKLTIILALTIALWTSGCETTDNGGKPKSSEQKEEKKPEVGMTKDQILALFGKTDNIQESNLGETWIYNLNMGEMFIPFNFGYRPRMRIINFDKDGKVSSWNYSK